MSEQFDPTPELEQYIKDMNIRELKCWSLDTPKDIRDLYNYMVGLGADPDEALSKIKNVVGSLADYYEE